MPTYFSSRVSTSNTVLAGDIPARQSEQVTSQVTEITIGTALVASDIIQLFTLPRGAVILNLIISSNGTQSGSDAVFTVGDTAVNNRYILVAGGLALRTGGGVNVLGAHTGLGYVIPAESTMNLYITTVGTGQTTGGVIRAQVTYAPMR